MVIPLKRRLTPQQSRRSASHAGSGAQARNTSLRVLPMTHRKKATTCALALAQDKLGIGRGSRLVSRPVHSNAALGGLKDGF